MSVEIQALWFKTSAYSKSAAIKWCADHDFKNDVYRTKRDADDLVTHHIFPQFQPDDSDIVEDSWAVLSDNFPDGITASVCVRRKSMELKHVVGHQSKEDPYEFVLSDESVDRMGDVIRMKGWELDQFKKNPIALFGHDHSKIVGIWEDVRTVGKELRARLKIAAEGTSAEIDTIRKLVEQRILRAVSVGFQPLARKPIKETGGYEYLKQILHEGSLVAVPANPNALNVAKSMGDVEIDLELANEILKKAVPSPNTEARERIEISLRRIEKALQ